MPGAYRLFSHTAREDGGTDSAMRSCVPAPLPQPATMFRIAHCEQGQDMAGTQNPADVLRVIGPVPQHTIRATARPTTRSLERRNAIEQG